MKKYKKVYIDYYDYCIEDVILCEHCSNRAVDIHHIKFRSQGGKDIIDNLIALCRECHNKAHNSVLFNKDLKNKKIIEFKQKKAFD